MESGTSEATVLDSDDEGRALYRRNDEGFASEPLYYDCLGGPLRCPAARKREFFVVGSDSERDAFCQTVSFVHSTAREDRKGQAIRGHGDGLAANQLADRNGHPLVAGARWIRTSRGYHQKEKTESKERQGKNSILRPMPIQAWRALCSTRARSSS